jgi:hypothetical protein
VNGDCKGDAVKHSSTRELYDYWNHQRGDRTAPERAEIEPGAIRRTLGDSFILAYDPQGGHPFRLAGTRICGLFIRELRSEPFESLWDPVDRPAVHRLLGAVADEMGAVIAGATGRTAEGYQVDLELLLLPLRHRGKTHARQIGVLAPLTRPYWLGSSPVGSLALGSHRHLGSVSGTLVPVKLPAPAAPKVRHRFVVYDGGRSK